VTLPDLLSRGPLINFAAGTGLRKHVDEALRRAGLETDARFELSQASDMLRFAAAGLGVTIVPQSLAESMAPEAIALGPRYRVFELDDRDAAHPVSVIYHPARLTASARQFLAMLLP
jgi:DNA-binding transcriptional LysR family regulator